MEKNNNELLGLRGLNEIKTMSFPATVKQMIKDIFTLDWFFSKWYEKLIVVASLIWGFISLLKLIIGVF
jgi:hypothetical protein